MKLKIGLVDTDTVYAERFLRSVQPYYSNEIELHVYTNAEEAYKGIKKVYPDVFLVAEEVPFDTNVLPEDIALLILTPKDNVMEINGIPAISKYHQKISDIYHEILSAYAEVSAQGNEKKKRQNGVITLFVSAQGGSGTSSVSAAYAIKNADNGKKVFYLDLDLFGDVSLYFSGDGKKSFTDVINALKKEVNLEAKIQSSLKKDDSGVSFFDTCRNAYDMIEFRDSELEKLMDKILEQPFEHIVLGYSGDFNDRLTLLMTKYADQIIYVNDGSRIGNRKFQRFCEAVTVIEQKREKHILNKMKLLYNGFSSKTGEQLEETAVPLIGGIHRIIMADNRSLALQIASLDKLDW